MISEKNKQTLSFPNSFLCATDDRGNEVDAWAPTLFRLESCKVDRVIRFALEVRLHPVKAEKIPIIASQTIVTDQKSIFDFTRRSKVEHARGIKVRHVFVDQARKIASE